MFGFCVLLFALVGSRFLFLALAIRFYLSLLPLVWLSLFTSIFRFYLLFGSCYSLLSFAFTSCLALTIRFYLSLLAFVWLRFSLLAFSWFLFLIFVSHFCLLFIASISLLAFYMAFTFHSYFFVNLNYLWLYFRSWFYFNLSFNSWFSYSYLLHILKYLSILAFAFRFCFLIHVSIFCLHSSLH